MALQVYGALLVVCYAYAAALTVLPASNATCQDRDALRHYAIACICFSIVLIALRFKPATIEVAQPLGKLRPECSSQPSRLRMAMESGFNKLMWACFAQVIFPYLLREVTRALWQLAAVRKAVDTVSCFPKIKNTWIITFLRTWGSQVREDTLKSIFRQDHLSYSKLALHVQWTVLMTILFIAAPSSEQSPLEIGQICSDVASRPDLTAHDGESSCAESISFIKDLRD
ncbi:hypothetical protein AC1031_003155 [Aphanomyces cochlioides]|nr:hypothetical protein AC1031_003155 [Aphanomyces cochlioides]